MIKVLGKKVKLPTDTEVEVQFFSVFFPEQII